MTWKALPVVRGLLAGHGILIAGLVLAAPVRGQSDNKDDLLDRQRRLLEIQSQKVEADTRAALTEAQRLTASDPALALEKLRGALSKLEDDATLTEKRKNMLIRVLKDRIRVTELANRSEEKTTERPDLIQRRQQDLKETEKDEMQRSLDHIRALRKDGKMEEANQSAKELVKKYPNSPAAQAAARTAAAAEFLATSRSIRNDRGQRTTSVTRDVDRSATPPAGDVEFPKDFQERTKNRKTVSMTAKEKAILKALNTPVTVAFKDSRFQDVIDYIQTLTNIPILLDQTALDEAKITSDTLITVKVKEVTVRTLLRKILGDFSLAYIIKEESIQVTSALKARETMITRTYNIGDLVDTGGLDALRFGNPGISTVQIVQNVNAIIDLIQTSVDPDSWKKNGGQGTIAFHPSTMSLIVRNSAEVQSVLGGGLLK
jgi:hypothetical protein